MPVTRFPNFLLDWKPDYGKRLRGRLRKGWMACVLEDAADFTGVDNISRDAVKQLALKRVEWRNMLHRRRDVWCRPLKRLGGDLLSLHVACSVES